jgi:RND family efflux transporter MFP subunit
MRHAPLLALTFATLAFAAGCKRAEPAATASAAAAAPRAINVRVASVESSTASPVVRIAGILARQTEADLSFPLAGLLAEVSVRAGDRVKRGQPLARLQTEPVDAQLAQARSTVEKTKRDLVRIEKLQIERVATLENLQDARTAVTQSEAALSAAEFSRRHAAILAPADGVVLSRHAEPNEIVAAGRAVLTFAGESDGWIAKAGIPGRDLTRLALGARAEVTDNSGHRVAGKITQIAEAADLATRTVPVEILLEAPLPAARSGLVVAVAITPPAVASRAAVPVAALREGRGGVASLFLLPAGAKTEKRLSVDVEQVDGERAYLRTALPADARVVVAGGQFLADGTLVNVTD